MDDVEARAEASGRVEVRGWRRWPSPWPQPLPRSAGLLGFQARLRQPTGIESGASVPERVAAQAETLADDARVRAYEVLGDRPRAVEIMERRLSIGAGSNEGRAP